MDTLNDEMDTMYEVDVWDLVPPDDSQNPLGCRWVFRTKLLSDGDLDRLKACFVAKGYDEKEGVDFIKTFSSMVRTAIVRTILHFAIINR